MHNVYWFMYLSVSVSLSLSLSLFLFLMLLHGGVVLTQCYAAHGSRAMSESLDQYLAPWLVRTGWGGGVYSRTAFKWFVGDESRGYFTPGLFIPGIQRRDLKLDRPEIPQPKPRPKPKPTPQIQRSSRSPAPCPVLSVRVILGRII